MGRHAERAYGWKQRGVLALSGALAIAVAPVVSMPEQVHTTEVDTPIHTFDVPNPPLLQPLGVATSKSKKARVCDGFLVRQLANGAYELTSRPAVDNYGNSLEVRAFPGSIEIAAEPGLQETVKQWYTFEGKVAQGVGQLACKEEQLFSGVIVDEKAGVSMWAAANESPVDMRHDSWLAAILKPESHAVGVVLDTESYPLIAATMAVIERPYQPVRAHR